MDDLDVIGEAAFLFIAFTTNQAGEGRGSGGVNGLHVSVQAKFLWKTFTTSCIWAGEGRGRGRVN